MIRPGLKADYFDIGMGHLVHILSRAGVSFDQLAKDRILNVLAMDSTGIRIIRMNASEILLPEDIKSSLLKAISQAKNSNLNLTPKQFNQLAPCILQPMTC